MWGKETQWWSMKWAKSSTSEMSNVIGNGIMFLHVHGMNGIYYEQSILATSPLFQCPHQRDKAHLGDPNSVKTLPSSFSNYKLKPKLAPTLSGANSHDGPTSLICPSIRLVGTIRFQLYWFIHSSSWNCLIPIVFIY
jgi:hypothetical protein